jgi:hypothetical protein
MSRQSAAREAGMTHERESGAIQVAGAGEVDRAALRPARAAALPPFQSTRLMEQLPLHSGVSLLARDRRHSSN